ncbi:toxin-antitoxin system YwqK family antitoxin [Portibacter marinus]|uniref:toxin-antitoxin system YwqK family antitoxin n=1 Tax=Portibacter marinus TaxID=2898660 RepID=UPI001F2692BB|nr:hypothetical protein [Portibacter marinus]
MRFYILLFLSAILLTQCEEKPESVPGGIDLSNFETKAINGSNAFYVVKKGPAGNNLEEGMVVNGLQDGTWVTYWPDGDDMNKIKSVISYVNGVVNGPYMEFNNRGQVEKRVTYVNNQYHGLYSEYKFGRPIKEYMYDEGILDGVSKEYSDRGKLTKETGYKEGKIHGTYRQYDEEGNVVLEYEYKDGEKISGGIVTNE